MQTALDSMDVIEAMAEIGNPNSVSDAGVGALAARSAVLGAQLNVQINCGSVEDQAFVERVKGRAEQIAQAAISREAQILEIVHSKL